MIFSSPIFILLFLPVVFFGYFFLNRIRLIIAAKAWLVMASIFFYACWNIAYLPLLLGSILFNYIAGTTLSNKSTDATRRVSRRIILAGCISANLLLLGYFKYSNFLIANINRVLDQDFTWPQIILPLGISFFTFTQIAYLVDSYKGKAQEYNFINYALFVTFFPHLIAGPILHHKQMMPQFASKRNLCMRYKNIYLGLFIFSIGLFKKVMLADTLAIWANSGFDNIANLDFYSAWASSMAFRFQLYFDFSGYCDMAMGAALLFNIWLPINFNSPYKATNISDYWRRWHITLSNYLRDYVYIPLSGKKSANTVKPYLNIITTFLIGGMWHGAGWTFILWGASHGSALCVHRVWCKLGLRMPKALGWLLTFCFLNFSLVFFRSRSVTDSFTFFGKMLDLNSAFNIQATSIPTSNLAWGGWLSDYLLDWLPTGIVANLPCFTAIAVSLLIISQKNSIELMHSRNNTAKLAYSLLLFCVGMYTSMLSASTIFLYFNF